MPFLPKGAMQNGLMYAGLELAETIQDGKNYFRSVICPTNRICPNRGIKFNFPLDARTPSYDDTGDAAQKNIETMWDFDFWKNYLENMARYRYNLLTLWTFHPTLPWLKCPVMKMLALNDVCVYTKSHYCKN